MHEIDAPLDLFQLVQIGVQTVQRGAVGFAAGGKPVVFRSQDAAVGRRFFCVFV